jgi:Zn-dependent peptidase ImmA (M78 family)/transcriptional regulator with XRE-family HTH domain
MSTAENRVVPELFDGERFRQARIFRGLKKVDVAQALGVTASVVGQYERGKTRPSGPVFASIALHLGFPPQFFEKRRPFEEVVGRDAHFRMKAATSKMDRDQALVRLEFVADIISFLETHVELPEVDLPEHPMNQGAGRQEIESAAAAVRLAWGIGSGPIDNVVRLLEGHGTVVIRPAVNSNDVDAFSTWIADRPVIVLGSDKDDAARSRFDAAHELGHLVMHHDADPGESTLERQAHQFAGAFLMPAETIKREFPKRMNWSAFFDLKMRWHASLQALLYRARELEALSQDSYH